MVLPKVELVETKPVVGKGKGGKGALAKGKGKEVIVKSEEGGKGKGKEVVSKVVKEQRNNDAPTPPPTRKRPKVEPTSSVPSSSSTPKAAFVAPLERKSTPAVSSTLGRPVALSTALDLNDKDAYSSLFKSTSVKVRAPSLPPYRSLIFPDSQKPGPAQKTPIRPSEARLADPAAVAYVSLLSLPPTYLIILVPSALAPPISREAKIREIKLKREAERRHLVNSAVRPPRRTPPTLC